ncbi:MAG: hypothetical protein ABIE25_09825 [Thermoplasmatota archaeon]|nr:hypothetical protein [Candidatus Thermoplasmatota archaeon]MBU1914254.1 hypothetical protein [Candidatus Thermoplasmatota archaeon]
MTRKKAIFDEKIQRKLLDACSENEYIPIFLMLKLGMHPVDVLYRDGRWKVRKNGERIWHDGMKFDGEWLEYRRCKNEQSRRFLIPVEVRPKLVHWMKYGRRISPDGIAQMVRRVGRRIGVDNLSPMNLRHTFGIQAFRRYRGRNDAIALVASLMSCKEETARKYYLDLDQWMDAGNGQASETGSGFVVDDSTSNTATVVPKSNSVHAPKSMGLVPVTVLVIMARKTAQ